MNKFGIRSSFLVILYIVFFNPIYGQNCTRIHKLCFGKLCEELKIGLNSENFEFCEGMPDSISLNPLETSLFDSFYVDWCDGTVDTFPGNQLFFIHTYEKSLDTICGESYTERTIWIEGRKKCQKGISCANASKTVQVTKAPRALFSFTNIVCIDKDISLKNNSCYVNNNSSDAYLWKFGDGSTSNIDEPTKLYTIPGNYNVTLIVKDSCGSDSITKTIQVLDFPDAKVEINPISARDSIVCVGDVITLIDRSNIWAMGNKWTFPITNILTNPNIVLDSSILKLEKRLPIDTINMLDTIKFTVKTVGTYNFKLTSTNVCTTAVWNWNVKVVDAPVIQDTIPWGFICESGNYQPIAPKITSGTVDSFYWSFQNGNPAFFTGRNNGPNLPNPGPVFYNQVGQHDVTLTLFAECGEIIKKAVVTVDTITPVKILIKQDSIFCKTGGPYTLMANIPGGTWSFNGVLSSDTFDPKNLNAGKYDITYTYGPSHCQSMDKVSIIVVESEKVTTRDTILCQNTPITQLFADPNSGIWSGSPAVNASGLFDPALVMPGRYTLTYTFEDQNECIIIRNPVVKVEALPKLTVSDTALICLGAGNVNLRQLLQLSTDSVGGIYNFKLDNQDVPEILNLSNYSIVDTLPIYITYQRNLCEVSDSAAIIFINRPSISITKDTILCIDSGTFTLQSDTSGGVWSGPGINPLTGVINLAQAGSNTHSYTYTVAKGTSCEQNLKVNIKIEDPGSNLNIGNINDFMCVGPLFYEFSGYQPLGGFWSGPGIITNTDSIDVSLLNLDTPYTYTYCFKTASVNNCEACKSKTFTLKSLPSPSFELEGLACINETISLVNTSMGNNRILFEILNESNTLISSSTNTIFNYAFANQGTYKIRLTITDVIFGCTSVLDTTLDVVEKPSATFKLISEEGCAPLEVQIENTSSGTNLSYNWEIDNLTYNQRDLPLIFLDSITKDSSFLVQLTVSNQCGSVVMTDTIKVKPYPIINFGASRLNGCSPLSVYFQNASLGNPDMYTWDFGNGQTFVGQQPDSITFTTPIDSVSNYAVLLIGSNDCGTDSLTKNITVYPPDIKAFFEDPGEAFCQYDTIRLQSFSTPGAIITWQILNPDGSISGASGPIINFPLTLHGDYKFTLYAKRCGIDSFTVNINVLPAPPLDFLCPTFACVGSEVIFTNLSTDLAESNWDYGDGSTSMGTNGRHNYSAAGEYTVRLTGLSKINNCSNILEKQIIILGIPTASFTPSITSGCAPLMVSFTNNSTSNTLADWDFGDGTAHTTERDPKHTFQNEGTYAVNLTVTDQFGCFADTSVINIIVYPKPSADFTYEDKNYCHRYDTVFLIDQSIGSVAPNWQIDGQNFNTDSVSWFPLDSGIFDIKLISTSNFGCKDTTVQSIMVLSSPTSLFVTDNDEGCEDLMVVFTNQSNAATSYIWSFDNGTNSVDKNLDYTFKDPGNYKVSLIANASNGCPNDTFSAEIKVNPKPTAAFMITKDSLCGVPMRVFLENLSTGNVDNRWTIDNETISIDPDFVQVFNQDGNYEVQLIIRNEFLCADTSKAMIPIYLKPKASFEVSGNVCTGDEIALINTSTNAITYLWEIDGQGTTDLSNPSITFDKIGKYQVQLIAIYNEFCKDTVRLVNPINVYRSPIADFEYKTGFDDSTTGEVAFTNLSIDYTSVFWDLGDGYFTDEENPSHIYRKNRDIPVVLVAFNDNDGIFECTDTITKIIQPEWIAKFYAPNVLSPGIGSDKLQVFKPTGFGLSSYKLSVYAPWGQKVWETSLIDANGTPVEAWDGKCNGELVPQGSYMWQVELRYVNGTGSDFMTGSVTVLY